MNNPIGRFLFFSLFVLGLQGIAYAILYACFSLCGLNLQPIYVLIFSSLVVSAAFSSIANKRFSQEQE